MVLTIKALCISLFVTLLNWISPSSGIVTQRNPIV